MKKRDVARTKKNETSSWRTYEKGDRFPSALWGAALEPSVEEVGEALSATR